MLCIVMQVELSATLSLGILAGSPNLHSALTNRMTAKGIFMTAGIGCPPGVPMLAASSRTSDPDSELLQLHEGGLTGRVCSSQLCSKPAAAGHAHCAACHPAKTVWLETRRDGQNLAGMPGADEQSAMKQPGQDPDSLTECLNRSANELEIEDSRMRPGQQYKPDARLGATEGRASALCSNQALQSQRSSFRHSSAIAEVN